MPDEKQGATTPDWWRRRCAEVQDGPQFDTAEEWLAWWHGFPACTLLLDASGERPSTLLWSGPNGVSDEEGWHILWADCGVKFQSHNIRRDSVRIDGEEIEALEAWAAVSDGRIGQEEFVRLLDEPAGIAHSCRIKFPPHWWLSVDIAKAYGGFDVNMSFFKFGPDRIHQWRCTNRQPSAYLIPVRRLLKKERARYMHGDVTNLTLWYRRAGERDCRTLMGKWRRSGDVIDFSLSFCNIVSIFLKDGGCPAEVIEFFVKEVYSRILDAWLRERDSATFPTKAPRKWPQDKKSGENIREFIRATYGEHIQRGMNRVDVRKLDAKAVKALEVWAAQQNAKGKNVDINSILPRRSLKVDEVIKEFAAAGKPITEQDWRVRGVETPEARLRVRARRSAYRRAWGQRRKTGKPDPR